MSLRFPAELPARPSATTAPAGIARLEHGELLLGKVTRVSPDGMAAVRFAGIEARTRGGDLLKAGQYVLAHAQKTRGETTLSLLPNVRDGEILAGTATRPTASGVLARFGRFELNVRLPSSEAPAPAAGTQIRAQVQLLGGKPVMQMLPPGLSDSIFQGAVIAERNDGSVMVDIGGTSLIAASAGPVESGERIGAGLRLSGDKWILQILLGDGSQADAESAGKMGNLLARFLAEPQYARLFQAPPLGQLKLGALGRELLLLLQQLAQDGGKAAWASGLAEALEMMLLNPQSGDMAQQLAEALENSGIFFESRLLRAALSGKPDAASAHGDLKLALLLASQKLAGTQHRGGVAGGQQPQHLGRLADKVGLLLDAVTAEQLQNLRMLASNETYIQLPFTPGSGLESVEILISPGERHASRKIDAKNISLTLAVVTSNLGRVKAAISITGGQLSCRLVAERESVAQLLTSSADILKQGFEKLDYRVAYIDCSVSGKERDLSVFDDASVVPRKGLDVRA